MKFEKGLDDICANCRYDVKFNNNRNEGLPLFAEFKSYNTETWSKIANDKGFIKQFESYLQEVNKIEDLAYMINSNKANINEVKQAFKELFKMVLLSSICKINHSIYIISIFSKFDSCNI